MTIILSRELKWTNISAPTFKSHVSQASQFDLFFLLSCPAVDTQNQEREVKGTVHSKTEIQSLSAHFHTNEKLGDSFHPQNFSGGFIVKQHSRQLKKLRLVLK